MSLECKLLSFDAVSGCAVGEIINASIDESVLGDDGTVDPAKLDPLAYDPVHRSYMTLGKTVGKAYHDGKALK
jgi:hypothetical protein